MFFSLVSPAGLISIDLSVFIVEYNSNVSLTCKTGSGSNDVHTFAWFYNVSSAVCNGDCVGTDENLNAFLSGRNPVVAYIINCG